MKQIPASPRRVGAKKAAVTLIITAPCSYSPGCRRRWLTDPDRDDGAECGVCGNWLPRTVLLELLFAEVPA